MSDNSKNNVWYNDQDEEIFSKFQIIDGKFVPNKTTFLKHLEMFNNNENYQFEWKCIGRRPPTPDNNIGNTENEITQFNEIENTIDDDDGDFEFEDELSQLNLSSVRRNAKPKGSAKKMTTSLQSILSNIARHRKLDMLDDESFDNDNTKQNQQLLQGNVQYQQIENNHLDKNDDSLSQTEIELSNPIVESNQNNQNYRNAYSNGDLDFVQREKKPDESCLDSQADFGQNKQLEFSDNQHELQNPNQIGGTHATSNENKDMSSYENENRQDLSFLPNESDELQFNEQMQFLQNKTSESNINHSTSDNDGTKLQTESQNSYSNMSESSILDSIRNFQSLNSSQSPGNNTDIMTTNTDRNQEVYSNETCGSHISPNEKPVSVAMETVQIAETSEEHHSLSEFDFKMDE